MKLSSLLVNVAVITAVVSIPHVNAFGCKPEEVKGWITACDSVTGTTQAKCNNRQCHNALHRLVEEETIQCYVDSGLGPASDLGIYQEIDAFCHGEGPDPGPKTLPPFTSAPSPTTTPVGTAPLTPTTGTPLPDPGPTISVPVDTPTISPGSAC